MKGLCFHDAEQGVIYGDGLVRAYKLEKSIGNPKIIIEKTLFNELGIPFVSKNSIDALANSTAEQLTGKNTDASKASSLAFWLNAEGYLRDDIFINDGTHYALMCFEKDAIARYHESMGVSLRDVSNVILKNVEEQIALYNSEKDPHLKATYAKQLGYWRYIVAFHDAYIKKQQSESI